MTNRERIERLRRTYNLETYDYRDVAAALALLDEWEKALEFYSNGKNLAERVLALLNKEIP